MPGCPGARENQQVLPSKLLRLVNVMWWKPRDGTAKRLLRLRRKEGCMYIEGHGLTQEAMQEKQGGRGHCEK